MYPKSYFLCPLYYVTHEKLNLNKTCFPQFDKILVIGEATVVSLKG